MARRIETISDATMAALSGYAWPGNVRELRNVIERAMILSKDSALRVDLPEPAPPPSQESPHTAKAVEADHIRRVLEQTGWRVRGRRGAAEILDSPMRGPVCPTQAPPSHRTTGGRPTDPRRLRRRPSYAPVPPHDPFPPSGKARAPWRRHKEPPIV